MYKQIVLTVGILFSIEKWMVNCWKDGPFDAGINVCKYTVRNRGHLGLLLHSPTFNPLSDGKFMAKIFLCEKEWFKIDVS